MDYVACFRGENSARFGLKRTRNCFFEKHVFGSNFFMKQPPHLFSGPNGLCGSFEGENSVIFCLKCTWNRSSEEHISSPNFVTKPPPYLFSGPNGLFGSFWGENSARFCLKCPRNCFSKKHISGPNFFTKHPLLPIFEAKRTMWRVSRGRLHSLLPKTPPKSFFRKTRFRSELIYETAPCWHPILLPTF